MSNQLDHCLNCGHRLSEPAEPCPKCRVSSRAIEVTDRLYASFSDDEILARLRNSEDNFVERKTRGDKKDWLKAAVALANSLPIGYPGILFIGVRNEGDLEGGDCNFDSLQQAFAKELEKAYPEIYYLPKAVRAGEKECLAVIIPGSAERPHFAGKSYIRHGSQTIEASEQQFSELITQRSSKAREILKWKGKTIYVGSGVSRRVTLLNCNQFYLTYEEAPALEVAGRVVSIPLSKVDISFQHDKPSVGLRLEFKRNS